MNKLKYIVFIILLLFSIIILLSIYNNTSEGIKVNQNDLTLIIPNNEIVAIENGLEDLDPYLKIIQKDDMSGYSKGQGVPALSKQGVKSIYNYFTRFDVSVNDEQGYYSLQNEKVFKKFWELYSQGKNARYIHYTVLLTGELIRKDFIVEDKHTYVLTSTLSVKDNELFMEEIYGKEIKNLSYDKYGYFSYECILNDEGLLYGEQQYYGFKINSTNEDFLSYNQKYIKPISYYCNNMFTTSWKDDEINKINFNDLIEYLHVLDTDQPFLSEKFPQSNASNVRRIDSTYFEKIVQKYFNINASVIQKNNFYDKKTNSYPFTELCCRASHWKLPELSSEVIKVEKLNNLVVLTVNVMGYEEGYSLAFTHRITIQEVEGSFKYISNQVLQSDNNKIPEYSLGITDQILKEYN